MMDSKLTNLIKEIITTTTNDFNLLICGSRGFLTKHNLLRILLPLLTDKTLVNFNIKARLIIIEGGAKGADRVARDVAIQLGLTYKTFNADWDTHGKSAGYIRNAEMVNISHGTIALYDGVSKGTKHSINLSTKKGIPIMIESEEIANNLKDDEVIQLLVKNHLLNNLSFPIGKDGTDYLNKLEAYEGTDLVDYIGELANSEEVLPECINGVSLDNVWSTLIHAGYPGELARTINTVLLTIKDIITPKTVDYVYMKLDTGGFTGYQSKLRVKGEEVYPILRITLKVNDDPGIDLILNCGTLRRNIAKKVLDIHTASGLMMLSDQSEISLQVARERIMEYFKSCGIRSTNPVNNHHTHLVGFNTDFIRKFIASQLPGLLTAFSPKDIDVNQLSNLLEITGNYDAMPVPQVFRSDPLKYLDTLSYTVDKIVKPTL